MTDQHVTEWLAAYHDGELKPNRRRRVEEHLKDCPACRAQLESLAELSSLLRADLPPQGTSPQRFAAQVQLRLPRPLPDFSRGGTERRPGWVLGIPLTLILTWAFLQAGLWVTSLVLTAESLVLPGRVAAGGFLESAASLLVIDLILTAIAAILMAGWMAFWWTWRWNTGLGYKSNGN